MEHLSDDDLRFLRQAIALSRAGAVAREGGPFGAVIVLDSRVVGVGWNRVTSTADPTAHAEMNAVRDACRRLGTFQLTGTTVYTSCEPCPMCWAAIHWARCARVVYANTRDQAAAIGFDDARLFEELALPTLQRSIPAVHAPSEEARAVLDLWATDPAHIPY